MDQISITVPWNLDAISRAEDFFHGLVIDFQKGDAGKAPSGDDYKSTAPAPPEAATTPELAAKLLKELGLSMAYLTNLKATTLPEDTGAQTDDQGLQLEPPPPEDPDHGTDVPPPPPPPTEKMREMFGMDPSPGEVPPPPISGEEVPPPPGATETPPPTVDLDTEGLPWDPRINTKTRTKLKAGTWKLLRGVDIALVTEVKAELTALMEGATVVPAETVKDFAWFMETLMSTTPAPEETQRILKLHGLKTVMQLENRPDLIPIVSSDFFPEAE